MQFASRAGPGPSPGAPSDIPPIAPGREPPDIIIVPPAPLPDDVPEDFPPPVPPPGRPDRPPPRPQVVSRLC